MHTKDLAGQLHKNGYKDTLWRRVVLDSLSRAERPVSAYDLQKMIVRKHKKMSIVTVYRILDLFVRLGIVHKHSCSGKLSLCTHVGENGAHGYLHCEGCGSSEEFCSKEFSHVALRHANKKGFSAITPLLEIVGLCRQCS